MLSIHHPKTYKRVPLTFAADFKPLCKHKTRFTRVAEQYPDARVMSTEWEVRFGMSVPIVRQKCATRGCGIVR